MSMRIASRSHRRTRTLRRLLFQPLEPRVVLAGNVVASLAGGTLTVTGDNADNTVLISTFEDPEKGLGFRVEGEENNGPTRINGDEEPDEFFGVQNLNIQLRGGNDDLGITNDVDALIACLDGEVEPPPEAAFVDGNAVHVPGWVVIKMGDGNNRIGIGPAEIGQHMLIQGGKHSDAVGLCAVDVGTNLTIQTLAGEDGVFMHESGSGGTTTIQTGDGNSETSLEDVYAQALVVQGGKHEDDVSVVGMSIEEDLIVQTFGGDDSVSVTGRQVYPWSEAAIEGENGDDLKDIGNLLLIQTGDGQSKVDVFDLSAGEVSVLGGKHDDSVFLKDLCTDLDINVNTLGGHDDVEADTVEARSLIILTGAGNDDVFVGGYIYGGSHLREDLIVNTNSGSDRVAIGGGYGAADAEGESGSMEGVNVGDDLVVDTGSETDLIDIFGYRIGGDVVVNAGSGDDSGGYPQEMIASSSPIGGGVSLRGLDIAGHFTLLLGAGRDAAAVVDVRVGGNATVDAGAGDDGSTGPRDSALLLNGDGGVELHDLVIGGNLLLALGAGNDQASVSDTSVGGNATVDGGSGNDQVELDYLDVADDLFAFMGAGNDDLFVDSCSAKKARLFGGAGKGDRFFRGTNDFDSEEVKEFEQIVT